MFIRDSRKIQLNHFISMLCLQRCMNLVDWATGVKKAASMLRKCHENAINSLSCNCHHWSRLTRKVPSYAMYLDIWIVQWSFASERWHGCLLVGLLAYKRIIYIRTSMSIPLFCPWTLSAPDLSASFNSPTVLTRTPSIHAESLLHSEDRGSDPVAASANAA